jgi:hypothetical protein
MAASHSKPTPNSTPSRSLLQMIGAVFDGILTFIRKAPMVVLFGVIALILYYQQAEQPQSESLGKFSVEDTEREPEIPADFPKDANPSVLTCVYKVNADLDKSLWADVYYGMEVRLDGKMLVAKVTEQWQGLSDDKRATVTQLIVDTWVQHAQALQFITARDDMEEVVIKRVSDDRTVAAWKPVTGVEIVKN